MENKYWGDNSTQNQLRPFVCFNFIKVLVLILAHANDEGVTCKNIHVKEKGAFWSPHGKRQNSEQKQKCCFQASVVFFLFVLMQLSWWVVVQFF